MGCFIYGLAVALLLFEGIIIQCEGGGGAGGSEGPSSSNQGKDSFEKFNYRINNDGRVYLKNLSTELEDVIDVSLADCIIFIQTKMSDNSNSGLNRGELFASYKDKNSDVKLILGNYYQIRSFFEKYGKHVRKIHIEMSAVKTLNLIPLVFKDYATNLEELQALSFPDDRAYMEIRQFWSEISRIRFPKVKTFRMVGPITPTNFDLKSIFPELKYLSLDGNVVEKCLDNVKDLVELTLKTTSIPEGKFDSIFQKNNGITMLELREPKMGKTMQSIVRHLKDLKELVVSYPGKNFLLQAKNAQKCVLRNVDKFTIHFDEMHNVYEIERLTFEMPKLQELTLSGVFNDDQFVKFIEHFKKIKTVKLLGNVGGLLEPMNRKWKLLDSQYERGSVYTYLKFSK